MKKTAKLLLFVTLATLLLSALAFSVGAEGNEGWVVGDDGKEYYYDSNGEKAKKTNIRRPLTRT